MPKMVPKLILEGTRLTHKTDLAFALNDHPRITGPRKYRYHSPLVSAEWGALTNQPWGHGLINFEGPEEEALALETYRTWVRLFELQRYYSWIVDRFHLSTRIYQRTVRGRDYDFDWLEERLLPLGFRIILCRRDLGTFAAARTERLKVSGNPAQYDRLTTFAHEQVFFVELAQRSRLPVLTLDMTDGDIPKAADRVADWLEATGGLYLPDP